MRSDARFRASITHYTTKSWARANGDAKGVATTRIGVIAKGTMDGTAKRTLKHLYGRIEKTTSAFLQMAQASVSIVLGINPSLEFEVGCSCRQDL